jgi:hypothetical protein
MSRVEDEVDDVYALFMQDLVETELLYVINNQHHGIKESIAHVSVSIWTPHFIKMRPEVSYRPVWLFIAFLCIHFIVSTLLMLPIIPGYVAFMTKTHADSFINGFRPIEFTSRLQERELGPPETSSHNLFSFLSSNLVDLYLVSTMGILCTVGLFKNGFRTTVLPWCTLSPSMISS